mgnify:CR=1 FL=1
MTRAVTCHSRVASPGAAAYARAVSSPETLEDQLGEGPAATSDGEPSPGLVLIFSVDRPAFGVIPLASGRVEIGRGEIAGVGIDDPRMSRAHARVAFDGRRWTVEDLRSRNGTALDGERVFPIMTSGASILSSTTRADGVVIIEAGDEGHGEGEWVDVLLYDG